MQRSLNANWKGVGQVGLTEYNNMVRRAKKSELPVEVSIEYMSKLYEAQNRTCVLSGLPLVIRAGSGNASIDRIDSDKGYVAGNVQWVDKRVNIMKNSIPEAEFIELCRLIILHKEPDSDVDN